MDRELTQYDKERIEKAILKRARKNAKRAAEQHPKQQG